MGIIGQIQILIQKVVDWSNIIRKETTSLKGTLKSCGQRKIHYSGYGLRMYAKFGASFLNIAIYFKPVHSLG